MWQLLSRLAGQARASEIRGDLTEERRRRAETSRVLAALWYWRQCLSIVLRLGLTGVGAISRQALRTFNPVNWIGHVRYSARALVRAPWYSGTIVGVIAMAMTVATTVFAVVDGVLFKPLPYPGADKLVVIEAGFRNLDRSRGTPAISLPDVAAWRNAMPDVAFTAFRTSSSSRLEEVNDEPFGVAEVDEAFFDTIGVRPHLGGFLPEHFRDQSGIGATIISYRLWKTRFDGRPDIVGARVVRGTAAMAIVGVMPEGFVFPAARDAQVLMPLVPRGKEGTNPRARYWDVIARLPADQTRDVATGRIEGAMAEVAKTFPPLPPPPPGMKIANAAFSGPLDRATLHPIGDRLAKGSRPLLVAVSIGALALLLLGCVSVSGLMAARSQDRSREIATRRALGAQAGDIGSLVVSEAAILVALGTSVGTLLSRPLLASTIRLLPADLTLLKTPVIDWRVVTFAALMTAIAAALVSLWPVLRGVTASPGATMANESRGATQGRTFGRRLVIASQVTIGLTLTLAGALFVGSLARLWRDDPGMSSRNVLAVELRIPATVLDAEPELADVKTAQLVASVRALPNVVNVGTTDAALFRNLSWADIGFKPPAGAASSPWAVLHGITGEFFDTLNLRLLSGRLLTREELDAGANTIVVSRTIASAYWPGAPAVGQSLDLAGRPSRTFEVVGIVDDARFQAWDDAKSYPIYGSMKALRRGIAPTMVVRTSGGDPRVLRDVLQLVDGHGPTVRAIRAAPLDDFMADSVRIRRLRSWLFGAFAVAALTIVGVGVLGLIAMTVARRTREIGVRMALGSTRSGVVRLVLKEQIVSVGVGLVAGSAASYWLARFATAYLYRATPYDPVFWMAAVLLVVAVVLLGALVPALSAGRVDPIRALRAD